MPRYRMLVEYDGSPYKGWQRQTNGHTVQAAIEAAIARFAREEVTLQVAGRTDTGVHATGQVSHADLTARWAPFKFQEAVNAMLREAGEAVSVLDVVEVDTGFHARFSAIRRHYHYRIINRRPPLALERERAWWVKKGVLDVDAMREAATVFLGTHDFTTFRAAQCQARSPVKTMETFTVERDGDGISLRCSARSFLHNQVRSMVGSLKLVGEGRWSRADLQAALDARDHQACGALAPPHGLYLTQVDYG
ncbi:MAG: tRNA pseudouridine(38-40) synthase TruA [Notoacmeibacter sp.]|nr:tRNA pseudouridine(38-40) synthase TruA [Notoacmeibacter sp.]